VPSTHLSNPTSYSPDRLPSAASPAISPVQVSSELKMKFGISAEVAPPRAPGMQRNAPPLPPAAHAAEPESAHNAVFSDYEILRNGDSSAPTRTPAPGLPSPPQPPSGSKNSSKPGPSQSIPPISSSFPPSDPPSTTPLDGNIVADSLPTLLPTKLESGDSISPIEDDRTKSPTVSGTEPDKNSNRAERPKSPSASLLFMSPAPKIQKPPPSPPPG
jgi:hypothetical protein